MENTNQLPEYVTQMYTAGQTQGSQQGKKPEDYINEMYDASLEKEKAGLQQAQSQANARLDEQKQQAQQQTDANLTRTYVEAAKAQKNYNEVQNAYGLTSGAMAQARLAQDNQLQGDLTAIRTAQQNVDAGIERERSVLAEQYAAAIQQAQANNDLARAEALYAEAQVQEERLRQQKANAANLMAGVGDYARLAELYGLTEEELLRKQQADAADLMAGAGDYSRLAALYGLTEEELRLLMGAAGGGGNGYNPSAIIDDIIGFGPVPGGDENPMGRKRAGMNIAKTVQKLGSGRDAQAGETQGRTYLNKLLGYV